jgi:hypothetical protein
MTGIRPTSPFPESKETWTAHRQDDNGNRFVVETGLSREDADRLVAELEARGHKQVYWAEPDRR